jgi:hypothetical protein
MSPLTLSTYTERRPPNKSNMISSLPTTGVNRDVSNRESPAAVVSRGVADRESQLPRGVPRVAQRRSASASPRQHTGRNSGGSNLSPTDRAVRRIPQRRSLATVRFGASLAPLAERVIHRERQRPMDGSAGWTLRAANPISTRVCRAASQLRVGNHLSELAPDDGHARRG